MLIWYCHGMKRKRYSKPQWVNARWWSCLVKKYRTWQIRTKRKIRGRVCCFFSTTNCLMGVNLSLILCSRFFGCYNFSSVSCCKSHRLCLYPGLLHSCEALISGTHSSVSGLADACYLVSSPAGSCLLSWCSPGSTNDCRNSCHSGNGTAVMLFRWPSMPCTYFLTLPWIWKGFVTQVSGNQNCPVTLFY